MKIDIITTNAEALKTKIFKSIGITLETWEIRSSQEPVRRFLTPLANQYNNIVILELLANKDNDKLTVSPSYWKGKDKPTEAVKAIVIGMFTAALLTHFSSDFSKLEITK